MDNKFEHGAITSSLPNSALMNGIESIQGRITHLKQKTKKLYFRVLLSQFSCPYCSGGLAMTAVSQCTCACGRTFDPTTTFQKSSCCNKRLVRKPHHYVCSACKRINHSRFLFDEKLFDRTYFREMMRLSRKRAKIKRDEMIQQMIQNQSGQLPLLQNPILETIPGLIDDLEHFVGAEQEPAYQLDLDLYPRYKMADYRNHILAALQYGSRMFSGIHHLGRNEARDVALRFLTVVFMCHEREVELTQVDNDLLIEPIENEAYEQG